MIGIILACFGTGLPSSGSLRTQRFTGLLLTLCVRRLTSPTLVILFVRRLSEEGTPMPKHVGVILITNWVLWFEFCCILLRAFIGQYTEYTKVHCVSIAKKMSEEILIFCPKHLFLQFLHVYCYTSLIVHFSFHLRFCSMELLILKAILKSGCYNNLVTRLSERRNVICFIWHQSVPRCKQFHHGYKIQSVNDVRV
jgi:hypothetical protein